MFSKKEPELEDREISQAIHIATTDMSCSENNTAVAAQPSDEEITNGLTGSTAIAAAARSRDGITP